MATIDCDDCERQLPAATGSGRRRQYCDKCRNARRQATIKAANERLKMRQREQAEQRKEQPKPLFAEPAPRLKPVADSYSDYHRWTAANHYELRYYDWTRRRMVTGHACDVGRGDDIGMKNRNELTEAGMV